MNAYSMDLRERVVAACDRGEGTREEIAERDFASESPGYTACYSAGVTPARSRRSPTAAGRSPRSTRPPQSGSARPSLTAPTPPWRNCGMRPGSPAAPRRCTARWANSGCLEKKTMVRQRARNL